MKKLLHRNSQQSMFEHGGVKIVLMLFSNLFIDLRDIHGEIPYLNLGDSLFYNLDFLAALLTES